MIDKASGSTVKALAKRLARWAFGDYSIYRVLSWAPATPEPMVACACPSFAVIPVELAQVTASHDPVMAEQAGYLGDGACGFGCFEDGRLIGLCVYWFGERYRSRNFWPLDRAEAKMVQIVVAPNMRGRGIALDLITQSSRAMARSGFVRLYARVWHSNRPSLRAFEKAGWAPVATVVELNPLRRAAPVRLVRKA